MLASCISALEPSHRNKSDNSPSTLNDQKVSGVTLVDDLNYEEDEANTGTDINDNVAPNPSRYFHTQSSQDAEASDQDSSHSHNNTYSYTNSIDPESFCNNCLNEPENDDIDMKLPAPIYEPNFIHECPSPWLHYGYCTACLEVARFESLKRGQGNAIIEHITQCPGLLNQCFPGEHEEYIQMNTERENELKTESHQ